MKNFCMVVLGSVIVGLGYNFFLIPNKILSSGLSGIAIMLGLITPINTGVLNFVLNLPLLIVAIFKLGNKFVFYTITSVVVLSVSLYVIPVIQLSTEPILSSLFGGVLTGLGIGIIFKASGSSGGFDIIAMLLAKNKDFPLGSILSALNGIVVIISGFVFNWDAALNTLVAIYTTGKVIDTVHTNHIKLTLMIITNKGDEMKSKLLQSVYRGITIMDGEGAYSGESRKVLLTVITRYQLTDVKKLIKEVDENAFVNITETTEVMGSFHRN
ncbi:YitT family protein [Heyndrickxia ginsengihumi]|uniref:YitT family protein n=1 Tax=Heyndrickxia ginsengihumi TaxID=363870 RepID=A0A6M0PBK2_9BACI|nr:YitT family protein [Heyndrickxia ginsengihumi]MBE6183189.1 YitT family protein [Bacillus sp. (in: firmicutes)]MCM3023861.1 YitT family protein [Heyndrickxia ginsengihumi]NEY20718.1 YitT family protein [Heyndrickxia ginsengihumi]